MTVLNSEEARAEAAGNEKSLYHIIKPEINFAPGTDEHDPKVYDKAVEQFNLFQEKGWLVQDDTEKYYVYAQTMNGAYAIWPRRLCQCRRLSQRRHQKT